MSIENCDVIRCMVRNGLAPAPDIKDGKCIGYAFADGLCDICKNCKLNQDYVNAADAIGYDLTVETVLLPRDMHNAHNNATEEHNRRLREQQAVAEIAREAERRKNDKEYRLRKEAEEKAAAEVIKKREAKYTYEADGFIIRPAMTSEEIIAEGKILQHCVGGYACRHMEGKLTICVMRDAKTPNVPFLTEEVQVKRYAIVEAEKEAKAG